MSEEDLERVKRFQAAWKEFTPRDRVLALDWIQAGAPDEDTAEGIAENWKDPS